MVIAKAEFHNNLNQYFKVLQLSLHIFDVHKK